MTGQQKENDIRKPMNYDRKDTKWGKLSTGAGRLKYQDIPKEFFAYTVTTVIAGEVYERLYRGASSRNRILYY